MRYQVSQSIDPLGKNMLQLALVRLRNRPLPRAVDSGSI